jgi:hypothetical protein
MDLVVPSHTPRTYVFFPLRLFFYRSTVPVMSIYVVEHHQAAAYHDTTSLPENDNPYMYRC